MEHEAAEVSATRYYTPTGEQFFPSRLRRLRYAIESVLGRTTEEKIAVTEPDIAQADATMPELEAAPES